MPKGIGYGRGMRRAPFKRMSSATRKRGRTAVGRAGRRGFNNVARPKSRTKKR